MKIKHNNSTADRKESHEVNHNQNCSSINSSTENNCSDYVYDSSELDAWIEKIMD